MLRKVYMIGMKNKGGAMLKGGGPWPPQNFENFEIYIYIIILMFSKFSLQK